MGKFKAVSLVVCCLLLVACSRVDYSTHLLPQGLSGERPEIDESYRIVISKSRRALMLDYMERHYSEGLYKEQAGKPGLDAVTIVPEVIVVHYTVLTPLEDLITYFSGEIIEQAREKIAANGALNVGIQFVVDRDGTIYQLYDETIMARHTIGLNHLAIGIENIGNGDLGETDKSQPLTEAQLESNIALVKYLAGKYPKIKTMIGHSEYRMLEDETHPDHGLFYEKYPDYRTDKVDPGDSFMKELRNRLN